MDAPLGYEVYSRAGGLLYLAALFLGISIAAVIRALYRRNNHEARYGTLASIFASLAVAAFALSLSSYGGLPLLSDAGFWKSTGYVFFLACLSVSFPRIVGFPVVMLLGAAVVFYGYFFLRIPLVRHDPIPLCELTVDSDGIARYSLPVGIPYGGIISLPAEGRTTIRFISVTFDRRLPVIGGSSRGSVGGVVSDSVNGGGVLFPWAEGHPFLMGSTNPLPGITIEIIEIPLPDINPNIPSRYTLVWDGSLGLTLVP